MAPRQRQIKAEPTQAIELVQTAALEPYKAVSIQEAIVRLENVRRFITKALNAGYTRELKKIGKRKLTADDEKKLKSLEIDFGSIPGVNKKFLLQPGAEKLCLWLHVRPVYETSVEAIPDNPGHIDVVSRCRLMASGSDEEVFSGPLASCSTMESNFRFVWVDMDPQPTYEWSMKEGKVAKSLGTHRSFKDKKTDKWVWQRRHDNPNIYDKRNPVRQMAEKRALVKAVRNFGALSEIFTEDPSEWVLDDDSNVTPEPPIQPGAVKREEPAAAPAPEEHKAEVFTLEIRWPSDTSEVAFVHIPECPAGIEVGVRIADFGFFRKETSDWQIPGSYVVEITEFATSLGMKVSEVEIDKKPVPTAELFPAAVPAGAKPAGSNAPGKGRVTQVSRHPGRQKNTFYYLVVLEGRSLYCYKSDWFEHLAKAKDQTCEFEIQDGAYPKIVGIKNIGPTQFEEGIPVIQNQDR